MRIFRQTSEWVDQLPPTLSIGNKVYAYYMDPDSGRSVYGFVNIIHGQPHIVRLKDTEEIFTKVEAINYFIIPPSPEDPQYD